MFLPWRETVLGDFEVLKKASADDILVTLAIRVEGRGLRRQTALPAPPVEELAKDLQRPFITVDLLC